MDKMRILTILFMLCGTCLISCDAYKILAIFPVPSGSHYIINSKLVNALALKGHEVTHITPYPQKNPVKNLKEISTKSDILNEHIKHNEQDSPQFEHNSGCVVTENMLKSEDVEKTFDQHKKLLYGLEQKGVYGLSQFVYNSGYVLTENVLKSEEIQKILRSKEKYDVVLLPQFLNEAWLGIAHHLQAPLVLVSTMPLFPWANFLLAHPTPPSYVPNLLGTYSGHMNFWQRLTNSFYDLYSIIYHQWFVLPKHRDLVKKYIPGAPDLYDFLNNASLILLNSHVSTYEALPQVPNAIEVGGFHIEEPKELPQDLQKFLNESVEGVIVFSMGSNLKSVDLCTRKRNGMLKAFSKLKQKVIMKWETDQLPGQPQNVKLMKWLPQSDVLAHPNVKLLINHGGLLSTMESIYYGKPVVGIPVFMDQKMNMATATFQGYAVSVPLQELGEETLSKALDQVLNDPKYRTNAQKRSKIMRDRPMKPIDTAIYWIEYVVRHQGAPHLRYPGADLTWYQRDLLDVVAFVLATLLLIVAVIFMVVKRIFRRMSQVKGKNKKND